VQALFFRSYRKFHGGALKVWDYFTHTRAAPGWDAWIQFDSRSRWDATNPWQAASDRVLADASHLVPDVFFVAGRDWLSLDQHPAAKCGVPVINLVQHVRHGDETSNRFVFLERKAIRICVGEEISRAVRDTGLANGPILVIPLGLDLGALKTNPESHRDIDVLIAGLKQPELGSQLAERFGGSEWRVDVLTDLIPRPEFLERMRRAKVTVFLPNQSEGVHMPPLEGMALGTLVVCPDVPGVEYCTDGLNCLRPGYRIEALAAAVTAAHSLPWRDANAMRETARETANLHSLERERAAFHDVLRNIDQLW
jgi:glycosyltransferase involved in cell wall biosynthesis